MPAGARRTLVTLRDQDGVVAFDPATLWVGLRALGPGASEESVNAYEVDAPYHPQISTDTRLETEDGRLLFVKGHRDVDDRGRNLVLYCEEVRTP